MAPQPLFGQCFLIIGASRSHSDAQQSVGLLWTSDQPYALTSLPAQHTDIHAPGGLRTHILSKDHTPQLVGLLWTSDQPYALTSLPAQHATLTTHTHIHAAGEIRTHILNKDHTPQLVGLLWTSDQPYALTSVAAQHTTLTTHTHTSMPPARFEPTFSARITHHSW